jgi:hypothetical protein
LKRLNTQEILGLLRPARKDREARGPFRGALPPWPLGEEEGGGGKRDGRPLISPGLADYGSGSGAGGDRRAALRREPRRSVGKKAREKRKGKRRGKGKRALVGPARGPRRENGGAAEAFAGKIREKRGEGEPRRGRGKGPRAGIGGGGPMAWGRRRVAGGALGEMKSDKREARRESGRGES